MPKHPQETLRRNVKILLAQKETNLSQLCEAAEIDQNVVRQTLLRDNPTLNSLARIAELLGVEIWELLRPMR